jgi:hypothetical protein
MVFSVVAYAASSKANASRMYANFIKSLQEKDIKTSDEILLGQTSQSENNSSISKSNTNI